MKKFQCHICGKEYDKQFNFNYHVAHHFNARPFACDFLNCTNSYKTKADLRQHQKSHEKSLGIKFSCADCGLQFESSTKLNVHKRENHSSKAGWCNLCNRHFTSLRSHIDIVHKKIRRFICDLDGKRFGKMHGLIRHIDCVHLGLTPYECLQCNKSFKEAGSLKNHMKRHAAIAQKFLKNLRTRVESKDWSEDEEIVTEKTRFKCNSCSKVFFTRSSLMKHESRLHSNAEFSCDLCSLRCVSKKAIAKHIVNIHVLNLQDNVVVSVKIYKCGVCKKIVNSKKDLERHKKNKHLENQDFLCEHCSAPFSERGALNKHLKKHHNQENSLEKDFKCNSCSRSFSTQYNLEKHETNCRLKKQELHNRKLDRLSDQESLLSIENEVLLSDLKVDVGIENITIKQEPTDLMTLEIKEEPLEADPIELYQIDEKDYEMPEQISELQKFQPEVDIKEEKISLDKNDVQHLASNKTRSSSTSSVSRSIQKYKCKTCAALFDTDEDVTRHHIEIHLDENLKETKENCPRKAVGKEEEARRKRMEYMRNYRRLLRERETADETSRRRAVHAEKKRLREQKKREEETEEEGAQRRAFHAEQKRIRMQRQKEHETEEEAARRKAVNSQRVRETRKAQRECEIKGETAERVREHETEGRLTLYCDQCGASFIDRRTLKSHTVRFHSENTGERIIFRRRKTTKQITCEDCNEVVYGKNGLLAHRLNKHFNFKIKDKHKFHCLICEQVMNCRRTALRHHRQVHNEGTILLRTCQECNTQFKLFEDFKRHVENDHENAQICLICGVNSKTSVEFLAHKKSHRTVAESEKTLACDLCGFKAQQKATIDLHMVKIHNAKRKEYFATCEFCGEFFNCYQNFHTHRLKHRPRTIYTYNCSHCEKKCYNMRDLRDHEISHTNPEAKPYRCQFPGCFREYFVFRSYQCHIESHQENRNQCKICQTIFSSREKLIAHTEEIHPELRRFSCPFCRKSFATNAASTKHIKHCLPRTIN